MSHISENKRLFWQFASTGSNTAVVGVAWGLIKQRKHKTGMEGTYAGTGSAMALAASDGTQDCCSGFSIAGRVTYNHIRIVQAQGMTKLGVAERSRAKHGVGVGEPKLF